MLRKQLAALIMMNLVLIGAIAWFSYTELIPSRNERFDFIPHWVGGRAIWGGETPYTDAVTARIQLEEFGYRLPPDVDQQRMAYPAYVALLIAPLLLLPATIAIAIWTALQLIAMLWLTPLWLSLFNWRLAGTGMIALILLLTFVFRYPINVFVLGQFTGTMLLLISLGVWCLINKQDRAAGVLLAFATIPPTVSAPLAVLILGSFALHGRWQGLFSFVISIMLLIGLTVLRIGWWIPDFLKGIVAYTGYSHPVWPPQFIGGLPLQIIFLITIAVILIQLIAKNWQPFSPENQIRLIITLMLACQLLVPQTGNYYLILTIPSLIGCFYDARNLPRLTFIIRGLCVLIAMSPWLLFFAGVAFENTEILVIPLVVFTVWYALHLKPASRIAAVRSEALAQPS